MEALLIAMAVIGGGAGMVFVGNRLGEARARVDLLKRQRCLHGKWRSDRSRL